MSSTMINLERRAPIVSNLEKQDSFNSRYAVIIADTLALQEQAYKLRYQVYCKEKNFENPDAHPQEQETDEFDARSVHSVIIDRPTRAVTAAVRLILPNPDGFENSFPIQGVCSHPMLRSNKLLHSARSAEISRFAVSKEFSRKAADSQQSRRLIDSQSEDRSPMPDITLGLMNGIVRMSVELGVSEWFAVMEPTLLRLLARFGIYFTPIGPMADYHGMRQPCYSNMHKLLNRVHKERTDVWKIVTNNGRLLDGEDHQHPSLSFVN